jgi:hypothetical protein
MVQLSRLECAVLVAEDALAATAHSYVRHNNRKQGEGRGCETGARGWQGWQACTRQWLGLNCSSAQYQSILLDTFRPLSTNKCAQTSHIPRHTVKRHPKPAHLYSRKSSDDASTPTARGPCFMSASMTAASSLLLTSMYPSKCPVSLLELSLQPEQPNSSNGMLARVVRGMGRRKTGGSLWSGCPCKQRTSAAATAARPMRVSAQCVC